MDSVEALIKKHEDFEKSLAAQEEKIKMLDDFATKLIESEHYAYDDVAAKRDQLLQRRNVLYETSANRRQLLEESYKFQTFERDCDETKSWINEKLKTASDESYLVRISFYRGKNVKNAVMKRNITKCLSIDTKLNYYGQQNVCLSDILLSGI